MSIYSTNAYTIGYLFWKVIRYSFIQYDLSMVSIINLYVIFSPCFNSVLIITERNSG